jgi:GAF domain-containing protein
MSGQDLYIHPRQLRHAPAELQTLLTSPDSAPPSLDLDEILSVTCCKAAVDLLKVDHSGLMVFDSEHRTGRVISEYPPIGTKGLIISLHDVPAVERMVTFKRPIFVPDIFSDSSFRSVSGVLREHGFRSVLIVPLIIKGRLLGSLGLDTIGEAREFTAEEIKLCEELAKQAAAILELYEQNRQRDEQLNAIQDTVQALNTHKDLRTLLDTITSQAVQLVRAKDGGISRFSPERGEFTVISDYNFPQAIGTTIKLDEGLAGHVLKEDLPFLATPDYKSYSNRAYAHARTDRFGAVLMVNLKWQNHTVGVLYINDERGREFEGPLPPLLNLLASAAAIAIANAHLLHESEVFRSSYEASSALVARADSKLVLQDLAHQALEAAAAQSVRLILVEEGAPPRNFIASRERKLVPTGNRIRPNGISMQVLEKGEPYLVEDTDRVRNLLNPEMLKDGSRAAMCLPLWLGLKRIGVIWIHYSEPREFSRGDVKALTTFLRQAIIAYDSARQRKELEPLRLVTKRVAEAVNTDELYKRIVTSAREFLNADFAALWPYPDDAPRELPVRDAVTSGIDKALLDELRDAALPVREITSNLMKDGWVGIPDIKQPSDLPLPVESRKLLDRLGARAFQGLGLVFAGEKLGVLYLIYKRPQAFHPQETQRARNFATHAARALKDGLAELITKAQIAAREVAKLTTLADWRETLKTVVRSTKAVLGCDAVTLFIYSGAKDRIEPDTTMVGVLRKKSVKHCEDAPRNSIVYKMIFQDRPYCVPRVEDDALFRDQHFVERERIKSVCAIPLKVKRQRVGVMFVNYRSPHNFTKPELATVEMFANQAAVAIRNGILYREQKKRLGEQRLLTSLSKQLLGAASLHEALNLAVRSAADSLKADCVAIVLPNDEGRLVIVAWQGWAEKDVEAYNNDDGAKYQTGHTVTTAQPVLVADYAKKTRFPVPAFVKARKINSGLSVPMLTGDKPVGAMLAHSRKKHAFTWEETDALSLIANLTAIAIQHQRAVESKIASLEAVQRASDEISRIKLGAGQREVLDKLVEQTVRCLPRAFLGTIQLYDEAENMLIFESVYAEAKKKEQEHLARLIGERRLLVQKHGVRIGIAGRAVLEKTAQRIDDVRRDPDYYRYHEQTISELAVPLLTEDNRVRGVLNVESKSQAAFSKDDEETLGALAKLAVTTIQNVETHQLVASSTLLAWLGMASSEWGHSVAANAFNIRDNVDLLREELANYPLAPPVRELLDDRLGMLKDVAAEIYQKPIAALLSFDEGLSTVSINDLISKRVEELWLYARYKAVPRTLNLSKEEPLIRCSPEWIKRVLEILIDNAIDAMVDSTAPALTISTGMVDDLLEISVTDTGPGIPPEIKDKLFRQRIEKQSDSRGLGVGLLMVEAIAQLYKGRAGVGETGPHGTTMYVRLPAIGRG